MKRPTTAHFHKYQALGNDMLVINPAEFDQALTPERVRLICHRHFGVGADGICYGPLPGSSPPTMRFYNPDGSRAEKSGNGLRIFARYLWDAGYVTAKGFEVRIGDDIIPAQIEDEAAQRISMGVGRASFDTASLPAVGLPKEMIDAPMTIDGQEYTVSAVSVGNPHCVIFDHEVSEQAARALGPLVENHTAFLNRINLQLAEVLDRHTLRIEIWERGAGYTLASGTSSCAAAAAAVRSGRCDSPVSVLMAGGSALVRLDDDWRLTLTGEVRAVAQGAFAADLLNTLGLLT